MQEIVPIVSAGRLKIRAPVGVRAHFGETIGLRLRTEALVVFDGRSA